MPDTEGHRWRGSPLKPYTNPGFQLVLGDAAIAHTLSLLQRFGSVESCVFWFGSRTALGGEVFAVIAPRQTMRRGNFNVDPMGMSRMADRVDGRGWRPLAQIHSHPGRNVEHSWYDDRMVASKRALSIVIPNYGKWKGPWPTGIGIHEWQDGFWHLLLPSDAERRVIVIDSLPLDVSEDLR